jgi:ABC-2 type transport system permease protein
MWRDLGLDLKLYLHLVAVQIRSQFQYKVNLLLDISTYFCITGIEVLSILLYFGVFPSLLGWHIGDVALLAAVTSICFGIAEVTGTGLDQFSFTIVRGDFDRMLLRPVGAFIQIIGSDFRLRKLGRVTQGVLAGAFALHLLPGLHWIWTKVLVLGLGMLSGAVMFVAILLLGATLCFWTLETDEIVNILTFGGREMLSYPLTIYNQLMQRFFLFIVPIAFGSYVPVCYVLGKPLPFGLPMESAFFSPLAALILATAAGLLWQFGIRHYQSTGS